MPGDTDQVHAVRRAKSLEMRVDHGVQDVIAQILVSVNGVTQISRDLVGREYRQAGKIDRCPACRSHHGSRTEREAAPQPWDVTASIRPPDIRMTYRLAKGKCCATPETGYGAGLFR